MQFMLLKRKETLKENIVEKSKKGNLPLMACMQNDSKTMQETYWTHASNRTKRKKKRDEKRSKKRQNLGNPDE